MQLLQKIAVPTCEGKLLNMVVEDLRSKGISPLYPVTNHTGFYERYGWEFLCLV